MKDFKIYLAGGMQNLEFALSNSWRACIKEQFCEDNLGKKVAVINPNDYYNFIDEPKYDSELEVMKFDLYHVRSSNLIIVNFNDPKSIGTAMELAVANEYNIPVIGFYDGNVPLHPWLKESCNKIFTSSLDDLIDYVIQYYLS